MAHPPDDPDDRDEPALADDLLDGPVPGPDDPPTAAERAHARGFGDLVDKVLAGRAPAALPTDDRALLEVATAIRAASRPIELPAARTRAVVEGALAQAIERRAGGGAATPAAPVVDLAARRARRRVLPWALAGAATALAAAALALLLIGRDRPGATGPVTAEVTPLHQRSRPTDPLIGRIPRERAGEAAARLDVIYADRMAGYRERSLTRPRAGRGGGR